MIVYRGKSDIGNIRLIQSGYVTLSGNLSPHIAVANLILGKCR